MKSKYTDSQKMKSKHSNRLGLGLFITVVCLLQVSCSTSNSEAWAKIQNEGLIPYLAENESRRTPIDVTPAPSSPERVSATKKTTPPVRQQTPIFSSGIVTAEPVKNRLGYVYSPHTAERLMVDVTDYRSGARVRCPYTKKSFIVPGEAVLMSPVKPQPERMIASTPARRKPAAQSTSKPRPKPKPKSQDRTTIASKPKKKTTAPRDVIVKPKKEEFEKMAVVDELPMNAPNRLNPPRNTASMGSAYPEVLALPKKEVAPVPVGKRVPGKANYVFSPFASSNQVVDVEGHSAGTKVKCPYTGKVFAVPGE